VAEVDAYLGALAAGDVDGAWARVCQSGFGASDRDTFARRHAAAPRPVTWQLEYTEGGRGSGSSAMPGRAGTPAGVVATVELEDGTRGEVRLRYWSEGPCQIVGDEPLVHALDPAPRSGG
jgi:hypothetical protein